MALDSSGKLLGSFCLQGKLRAGAGELNTRKETGRYASNQAMLSVASEKEGNGAGAEVLLASRRWFDWLPENPVMLGVHA